MRNVKDLSAILADCAAACEYCADACLNEDNVKMLAECIRLDQDCADICITAMKYIARDSKRAGDVVEVCTRICTQCAEECEKHADHHDHCRRCAEACRECEEACKTFSNV